MVLLSAEKWIIRWSTPRAIRSTRSGPDPRPASAFSTPCSRAPAQPAIIITVIVTITVIITTITTIITIITITVTTMITMIRMYWYCYWYWYWLLVIGYLVIGHRLLVIGCWLSVIGCWLLVIGYWSQWAPPAGGALERRRPDAPGAPAPHWRQERPACSSGRHVGQCEGPPQARVVKAIRRKVKSIKTHVFWPPHNG